MDVNQITSTPHLFDGRVVMKTWEDFVNYWETEERAA